MAHVDVPPIASKATAKSMGHQWRDAFREHPHACLAMSDAATWGTPEEFSEVGETDVPSDTAIEMDTELEMDDDWVVGGHMASIGDDVEVEDDEKQSDLETAQERPNDDEELEENLPGWRYLRKNGVEKRKRRRHQQQRLTAKFVAECVIPIWCASAALQPHLTDLELNALQQMQMESGSAITAMAEPGKTVVAPEVVRKAEGADLDAWILAAQDEHDRFGELNALQRA